MLKWIVIIFFITLQTNLAYSHNTAILENEFLKIVLDLENKGQIINIYSKSQKKEHVDQKGNIPLYHLELNKKGNNITIDSNNADQLFHSFPTPSTLKIKMIHFKLAISVTCTIKLPTGSKTVGFSIEINREHNNLDIDTIRYPGIGISLKNTEKSSNLLLPIADGMLITNPAKNLKPLETKRYPYPGIASAQLMALYDTDGGLFTYAADGNGYFKHLEVRRYSNGLMLLFVHFTNHLKGKTVKVPYYVEVGSFKGNWKRAADIYKKWAKNQKWCNLLLEDKRLPKQLTGPSFFFTVNLRKKIGEKKSISRINKIPGLIKEWRKGIGLPVTTIFIGWEKRGPWITPDYFPPYGGINSFKNMVTLIKAQDSYTMLLLSGLNYTIEKTPRYGAGYYKMEQKDIDLAKPSAIVNRTGKVKIDGVPEKHIGKHLYICPSTEFAQNMLSKAFRKAVNLGLNNIQVDGIVGGGLPPCFSKDHNHPPGGGQTTYKNLSRILDNLSIEAKKNNREIAISLEEPGELYIPHVDIFHTREFVQKIWPRNGKGVVGVPLFNYLYHEYALGYGGINTPLATDDEDIDAILYVHSINLITGRMPAMGEWWKLVRFKKLQVKLKIFMQDTASLLKSEAGPYILFGKIIDIAPPDLPGQNISFKIKDQPFSMILPKVLSRGFQLKDGSKGFLFINSTDSVISTPLSFSISTNKTKAKIIWPRTKKTFYSGDKYNIPPRGIIFLKLI